MNINVIPDRDREIAPLDPVKFQDPDITAKGEVRAHVDLTKLETLWFNTGTLCNLTCESCYIESSPTNDRLLYITLDEFLPYLAEIKTLGLETREIAFTGGEPFMNPDIIGMTEAALVAGFDVLILTNAMRPMMKCADDIRRLHKTYGSRMTLRVSLDHYSAELHERERGVHTWEKTMPGLEFLRDLGAHINIAGRTCWGESEEETRRGFGELFAEIGLQIDENHPGELVLFPEMDERQDVPEITVDCWRILNVAPASMMCATSRMVVKHKGDKSPTIMPCTLLPYDRQFDMGTSLSDAPRSVKLNHPHCAKFCVLGGGSCTVGD